MIKTIKDIKDLKNKRVLVRVDFNVPIKNGKVQENYRIKKVLPTIEYLLKHKAQVILVSHLGRPTPGKFEKKFSLAPVAKELEKLLKRKVSFVCHSELACPPKKKISGSKNFSKEILKSIQNDSSNVVLLENIRFCKGEAAVSSSSDYKKFAKELAGLADIFVMDGFAVAHRDSPSVSGVAKFLPAFAGLLVEEEVEGLTRVINKPKKPLVVILGGIKCETKIPVLENLLPKASQILLGGGIVNTYLWAKGFAVGKSLIDKDFKNKVLKICKNKKVILPVDLVVGDKSGKSYEVLKMSSKFPARIANEACRTWQVPSSKSILSVGPETVQLYAKYIKKAKTLILNGAIGYFEQPPYQHATYAINRLFAARSKGRAFGVAGGGETVQVLKELRIKEQVDLVSTGGGAMLEFLAGKKLPGIEVLKS